MLISRSISWLRPAFLAAALCLCNGLLAGSSHAYIDMLPSSNPTPKLHVTGRFLQDPNGHNVLLHGYYQPAQSYFNGHGSNYPDPTNYADPNNVAPALNFLNAAADVYAHQYPLYNQNHGWYCNFVRLNGTNNNASFAPGWDANGNLVDSDQFNGWLQNLVVPYINHCRQDGLYVVLLGTASQSYPGGDVTHNMTSAYQQSLNTFWQIVASTPGIKNADNVQFELCNEPIKIETTFGAGNWDDHDDAHASALTNFLQPLVNTIRQQGADNIVWAPGLGYQSHYEGFVVHPVQSGNVGYAAHFYPGYISGDTNSHANVDSVWNARYKPCADLFPMMITEMYWQYYSPDQLQPNPDGSQNYNYLFLGITGDSSYGFGTGIRNDIDAEGNVSYLIGGGDPLLNLDNGLQLNSGYAPVGGGDGDHAAFGWFPDYGGNGPNPTIPQTPITLPAGLYQITSANSPGMAVDVYTGSHADGTPIWQWYSNAGDAAQQFYLNPVDGNNNYWITVGNTNASLSVSRPYAGAPPSLNVINSQSLDVLNYNGGLDQQWIVIPIGNGNYRLASDLNPNQTLDEPGGSSGMTALQTYFWGNQPNQEWRLTRINASSPRSGQPINITAQGTTTVEAEDYDNGGEGVAYHDMDSADLGSSNYRPGDGVDIYDDSLATNGHGIGWTQSSEWMNYTVNVSTAGNYTVGFRVATVNSGTVLHLEDTNGANLTGSVNCYNSGGWSNYWTIQISGVYLSVGVHVLKLYEDTGGYNLDNITFTHS